MTNEEKKEFLGAKKVAELREIAAALKVELPARVKKAEIVDLIAAASFEADGQAEEAAEA